MKLRIGAFASHGGSNLQAIIDACKNNELEGEVSVVISNNSDSLALERAKRAGIPAYHMSSHLYKSEEELAGAILSVLEEHSVNIICLCGYMKKLGMDVIRKYENRILNIHPALLPKYGGKGMYGMNVHKAVIQAKEEYSGVTIHLVNDNYDEGRILAQERVPVLNGDTPEILQKRVLEKEHVTYVETLKKISEKMIKLD